MKTYNNKVLFVTLFLLLMAVWGVKAVYQGELLEVIESGLYVMAILINLVYLYKRIVGRKKS